jgi:hypothetical protein
MIDRRRRTDSGFSLVEVLIACGITAAIMVIACRLAADAQIISQSDGARIDLQQRVRVAADVVSRSLLDAGGGANGGPARGSLVRFLPAVTPRRTGLRGAHAPHIFKTDAWTVVRAISEAEHAALLLAVPPGVATIEMTPAPACALAACGFTAGTHVLLADGTGNHDVFTVTVAQGMVLTLRHHGSGSAVGYPAGTPVIAVDSSTYFFDSATYTLRQYDGDATDVPLLDDVIAASVRYFGDVEPPAWPRATAGTANCLYSSDGTYASALMPVLPGVGGRTELTAAMLTDGPWCGAGDNQFDADLLRIRRVRVTCGCRRPTRRIAVSTRRNSSSAAPPATPRRWCRT